MTSTITPLDLPPLLDARLELYNNGYPPTRGTQFGIVLDLNNSQTRFNINFEDNSDGYDTLQQVASKKLISEEEAVAMASVFEVYKLIEQDLDITISYGKRNLLAGEIDPITGKPRYKFYSDYRVWMLFIRNAFNPKAALFYGDKMISIRANEWTPRLKPSQIANTVYGTITHVAKLKW